MEYKGLKMNEAYFIVSGLLITLAAAIVQGMTGFGFALLAMPLLSLFLPLDQAVPMVVMLSLVTNVFVLCETFRLIDLKKIWILIVSGIVGIPLGVYLLKVMNPDILKTAVGCTILVTAVAMVRGFKVQITNETASFALVGLLSGVLNGSISLSGPPVVLFLSNQGTEKNRFRGNLALCALITNIITVVTMLIGGIIQASTVIFTLEMLPALIFGVLAGMKAAGKVDEVLFRKVTLYLISVLGIWTFITAMQKVVR